MVSSKLQLLNCDPGDARLHLPVESLQSVQGRKFRPPWAACGLFLFHGLLFLPSMWSACQSPMADVLPSTCFFSHACIGLLQFFIFTLSEFFLFSQFASLQEMGHGSTQQTVYCAYKWELLLGVWTVFPNLESDFRPQVPPPVFFQVSIFPAQLSLGRLSRGRDPLRKPVISPSWGPHTEPAVSLRPEAHSWQLTFHCWVEQQCRKIIHYRGMGELRGQKSSD